MWVFGIVRHTGTGEVERGMAVSHSDWEKAQAFFRTDPLKYLVHLKYMYLYGDSITCSVVEQKGRIAVLLRYPTGRVVWDAATYSDAEYVLLPAAETVEMAEVLLSDLRQSGLLARPQVIKFCELETESLMCGALKLQFARALTSYTSTADAYFEADPDVRMESQPNKSHMEAFIENGYSVEEVLADFAKGAKLFSLYEGDTLLSNCMTYRNFDTVWEVAGVHTSAFARRKGYARRVVQTALAYVLGEGYIPRYHVEDVNKASINLAEGLGLKPCLRFNHYLYDSAKG